MRKTLTLLLALVLFGVMIVVLYHPGRDYLHRRQGIVYVNTPWSEREALQQLAQALHVMPAQPVYRVRLGSGWHVWLNLDDSQEWEVRYDRTKGRLTADHLATGEFQNWSKVTDAAIQQAASGSAKFQALARYGCVDTMP